MNSNTLDAVIDEAARFLEKAKELQAETLKDKYVLQTGSVLSGSVRRSSMELTRALTEFRKSG